jgi:hypothetical protein
MEIRLRHVLPGLIALGAMVNLALTQPRWYMLGFADVSVHANRVADYSSELADLTFAPIDPDIIEDASRDVETSTGGENSLDTEAQAPTNSNFASPTPILTLEINATPTSPQVPTLPLPTLPLPTVQIPTLEVPTDLFPPVLEPILPVLTAVPDLPIPTVQLLDLP